jgi:hypothetical protein
VKQGYGSRKLRTPLRLQSCHFLRHKCCFRTPSLENPSRVEIPFFDADSIAVERSNTAALGDRVEAGLSVN